MTSDNDAEADIDPERRTAIKSMGFFGMALTELIRKSDGTIGHPDKVRDQIRDKWRAGHGHGRGKWCWSRGRGKGQDRGHGYDRDHPHFDDDNRWHEKKGRQDSDDPEDLDEDPAEVQKPDDDYPDEDHQEAPEIPEEVPDEDPEQAPNEDPEDPDETDVFTNVGTRIEMRIHEEVNEYRQANDLDPLTFNEELAVVARAHSQDMNDREYFNHISPDGDGPGDRLDDADIDCDSWAENIAFEYDPSFSEEDADSVAESIVDGWISSPGHRQNLLGDYDEQGIGVDIRDDGQVMATQMFCSNN